MRPFWLPDFVRQRTNVSRLFYRDVNTVTVYEVFYRRGGTPSFTELVETNFFQMRPFGYRTRLQRILALANTDQRKELANWLRKRLDKASPANPVAEIKFIRFSYDKPENDKLDGHYRQPSSKTLDPEDLEVINTYAYK